MSPKQIDFSKSITRSSFLKGRQCKKYLWLHRNQPLKKDKYDQQRAVFRKLDAALYGQAFKLFPKGVYASAHKCNTEEEWQNAIVKTQELIAQGNKCIYRPAFGHNNMYCDLDLIHKTKRGWEIVIIKSAAKFSDRNLVGAAYQAHVVEQSGLNLAGVSVLLINRKYRKQGDINAKDLFKIVDISKKIAPLKTELQQETHQQLKSLQKPTEPQVDFGIHCTEPHDCSYRFKCWKNVPKNSVFELVGFSKPGMFDLWARGIKTLQQIPSSQQLSFDHNIQQQGKVRVVKENLKPFLDQISYPALLVDFEGFLPAIPLFEGTAPFQLLPFLFSGYILKNEVDEGSPVHFLSEPPEDPRLAFCEHFLELANQVESILIYDPLTEKTILKSLKHAFPEKKDALDKSMAKIIDLSKPLAHKDFYLPEMKGYWGMKNVLPAIDPDLAYSNLPINSGRQAATSYQQLFVDDAANHSEILQNLTNYCKRDALGLLKVFKTLLQVVK